MTDRETLFLYRLKHAEDAARWVRMAEEFMTGIKALINQV